MKTRPSISGRGGEYSPAAGQISRVLVNQVKPVNQSTPLNSSDNRLGQQDSRAIYDPNQRASIGSAHADGDDDADKLEERESLREVYLYDCCGFTRELRPAHEYLATFKTLFHIFNTLVFLFGLADFGMGLWFRIDPKVYEIHKYIETQNFTIAGWIMLFGGFLACVSSLVGSLATIKSNLSLLFWYLIILIALAVSFVSTIIMLTIYGLGSTLELFLVRELYEQIRTRTMNTETESFSSNEAVQFLDYVQVKMRCCGASDFRDYQKLGMVIPTTCYTIAGNYINAPGCGRAIRRLMDIRAGLATGFTTGSVIFQLLVSFLCGLMICSIYNQRASPSRPAQSPSRARPGQP